MKAILTLLLCFFMVEGIAQNEAVTLETEKNENQLEFWVTNTSDYSMDIELFVFNLKNLRASKKTIKATIPANDKVRVQKMRIKGEYDFDYELKKSYSKNALVSKERNVEDVDLKEGIIVFNKMECSRCQFLVNYLMDNEIEFQLMDLDNKQNKKFMYQLLENSGVYEKRVMTPIVVVDEEVTFSHDDLEQFAASLK